MKKYRISIIIEAEGVRSADVPEYAEQALKSFGGCRHPRDPFFGPNKRVRAAKVTEVRKPRKKRQVETL